jgi:hypothetical protein
MCLAHQHAHQLADVQSITLGATLATLHRHRGGIDHLMGDALRLQKAVQPKAGTTGCLATAHRRGFRQAKASFGLGNFLEHARLVVRCDRARPRRVPRPRSAAELPGGFTPFKRQKQDMLWCGIMAVVGRCGPHGLSPPG